MKQITVVNDGPGTKVHKGGQDYRVPLGRHDIEDLATAWGVKREQALTIATEYVVRQIAGARIEVKAIPEPEKHTVTMEVPAEAVEMVEEVIREVTEDPNPEFEDGEEEEEEIEEIAAADPGDSEPEVSGEGEVQGAGVETVEETVVEEEPAPEPASRRKGRRR